MRTSSSDSDQIMGKTLMGNTPPAEAACGDSVIDIGKDESLLILVKHCKDMKHQETWLRLITLLLLLSCMALILCVHVQKWDNRQAVSSETFPLCAVFFPLVMIWLCLNLLMM